DYNTLANNSLFDNARGITVDGWNDYNVIDNNTVNYSTSTGMVVSYSYNNMVKYNTFYRNAGSAISLGNSNTNTMSQNRISYNTGDGIWIGVGGHRVLNNTVHHNGFSGVNVSGNPTSGNTPANFLDGNNVSYNGRDGITIWDSTSWAFHTYQNTITNNIARGNTRTGISLVGGTYKNVLRYNNASGNIRHGLSLDNAPDSTVINNTVAFNGQYGIYVTGTATSKIYQNNLIANTNQAYETGDNIWNLGYAGGGNYWSDWTSPDDYSGSAQDVAGSDGFVDTPRLIPGGTNRDNFPWTDKNGWYGYVPSTGPVVNTNTGEFFFLIQDAINDPETLNGHTLTVGAGMYFETVTVNKRLTIIGAGASVTTVRGGGSTDVITVSANWVNISGLKVMNGGSTAELAGIRLNNVQNCNISACTVTGNLRHGILFNSGSLNSVYASTVSANAGNGIYVYSTSSNRIIGNTIQGNLGAEGGIFLTSSSYNTVSGNIIRNHPQSGVRGYNADYNQISWNTLTNNSKATSGDSYRSGIYLHQYSDYNRINNNTLVDNRIALGTGYSITYNIWDNNTVSYSASSGMVLSYASNNLVKYCVFHHNAGNGISSGNSDLNTISRNSVYSNAGDGIGISVGGHKVLNNTVTNNGLSGINVTGNAASGNTPRSHLDGNNVSYNNRDGITLSDSPAWSYHTYFNNVTGNKVFGNNRTGIFLFGGTYTNTVRGNQVVGNKQNGIAVFSSNWNAIANNNIASNSPSNMILYSSSNNRITYNNATEGTGFGFNIGTSSNSNILMDNSVSNNTGVGIYICWNSGSNTVSKNRVNGNYDGIYVDKSSNNVLFNNTCANNIRWGLWFGTAGTNNRFYHNNLIGNGGSKQAQDDSGVNLWDNGYPGGGNYWSDYSGADAFSGASQNVAGSDGFGDTPYTFSFKQDNYPLMYQSVWWAEVAPVITLVSPADSAVIQAGTVLNFYVWDQDFNLDSVTHAVGAGPDTAFGVNYDIDTAGWADGDYSVRVDADDKLGNTAQQTFSFRIDSTDPVFTVGTSVSFDIGSDGCLDTGDVIAIWVNVTDLNEDVTTVPSIDVDETGFQDQPVDALAYQGSGIWTCGYTVQAGGFNISNIDVSFADMAGNLADAPDSVTFSIRGSTQMGFTSGWNLISFPMDSPVINGSPIRRASDLANQTAPVMISKWNPTAQSYVNFIPGFHLPTDPQNFAIGSDDAVFVFRSSAASYSALGYKAPGQRSVALLPGWNLVGYHAMTVGDVETDWAAQVSCGAMDDICYWDGVTFQHYIFAGTVMELTPGRGYFVWSDIATTLTY
ncbi:MAG: NosD domain-containing protein, partial [Thermoplasmata archaeon]|nr:NosD domain-containing protein [Thermoplasmata archaeon]